MKKIILPILLVLLFITTPASVFAQFPANCWDIMQDNTCLRNFTECNIKCGRTSDLKKYQACAEVCHKTSKACSDEQTANYYACVNTNRKASETREVKELKPAELQTDQEESNEQTNLNSQQNPSQKTLEQPSQLVDRQKIQPHGWIPLFATGWLDYFRNLWTIVSFKFTDNPFVEFINGFGGVDHELCDPSTCDISQEHLKRDTGLSEEEIINNPPSHSERESNPYKVNWQKGEVYIGDYDKSKGFILKTGQDEVIFSTFLSSEDDLGGVKVLPNTEINLPPQPFQDWKEVEGKDKVELKSGEAEFFIIGSAEKATTRPKFTVVTPNAEVMALGTHFWVLYKDNKTAVGVYKGKVEITAKSGQKTIVSPDKGKPGVVVITQKLSVPKLVIAGIIVVVLIIGVVWFLKRKSFSEMGNTGRKKHLC